MVEPYRQFTVTEFSGSGCSFMVTPYKSNDDVQGENSYPCSTNDNKLQDTCFTKMEANYGTRH